jgi:hypothetical protein
MGVLAALACLVFILSAFARLDDDPLNHIISQLEKWASANPVEKVCLQSDKPYYAAGDEVWFKAYITIGAGHQLSALSGVLNVELIDDRDSVKQRLKLPVKSGLTWGDLLLPDTLKAGNYRIRAYTNWMRNAGPAYFFDEAIAFSDAINNNIFTRASFSYNQGQINATIHYSDLNDTAYAGRQVSYTIGAAGKVIGKGNGQTDGKGNLQVTITNTDPQLLKHGRILTYITLADKKKAEQTILIKAATAGTVVQFFPEGGTLVNGNESKIAFKALGADGLGVDIKGVVTDDTNNRVAEFSSSHLGMGTFMLKPESGKTYQANITYPDGSQGTVALPAATDEGYSLVIDNSDAGLIHVKILPGPVVSASSSASEVLSLVAQAEGQVFYAGKSKPGSKFFTADLAKNKFPGGIVQFTLFSASGEPLNERLIFIDNHDQLKLETQTGQQVYHARQQVKIDLSVKDKDGNPVTGSFSAAVTNESIVPADENKQHSILIDLLLTSDLKGYVEQPGYYFNEQNHNSAADLDALLLTQGYRRFEWKQVLNDSYPASVYQPEKTLEISGHLKNLLGKPVANGRVTLFSSEGGIFMVDTVSDSKGNFVFNNLVFKDSVRFLVQARTAKNGKNIQVDIDNVQQAPTADFKNEPDFLQNGDEGSLAFLRNSNAVYANNIKYGINGRSILLKEVVIKDKRQTPLKNSENLNGPGNADQVIRAEDQVFAGCADIADCLQGRLFGVVFKNDTPYLVRSLHRPMQIILDGLYVDGSVLTTLNPSDIGSIEVLKSIEYTSVYGGHGNAGVLIITTKSGRPDYSYQRYAPGVLNYMPRGYTKVREFYAPQYHDPKTNTQIPDLRSTVYWNPYLITGKEGRAGFDYFNADAKGTYRVVIEGMDINGHLGRMVYRYSVQ